MGSKNQKKNRKKEQREKQCASVYASGRTRDPSVFRDTPGWVEARERTPEARGGWSSLRAAVKVEQQWCRLYSVGDAVTCEYFLFREACVTWVIWWLRSSMTQAVVYFWSKLCYVTLTSSSWGTYCSWPLEARNLHGPTRGLWNRGSVNHR